MHTHAGMLDAIGDTPLSGIGHKVKMQRAAERRIMRIAVEKRHRDTLKEVAIEGPWRARQGEHCLVGLHGGRLASQLIGHGRRRWWLGCKRRRGQSYRSSRALHRRVLRDAMIHALRANCSLASKFGRLVLTAQLQGASNLCLGVFAEVDQLRARRGQVRSLTSEFDGLGLLALLSASEGASRQEKQSGGSNGGKTRERIRFLGTTHKARATSASISPLTSPISSRAEAT